MQQQKRANMFPFRRGNDKRPNNGGNRSKNRKSGQQGGPRGVLAQMQPVTKALAQYLAGNTRQSGQIQQARALVIRAQKIVDEGQLNGFKPQDREDFLEQLARLKLTLSDAESDLHEDMTATDTALGGDPGSEEQPSMLAAAIPVEGEQPDNTRAAEASSATETPSTAQRPVVDARALSVLQKLAAGRAERVESDMAAAQQAESDAQERQRNNMEARSNSTARISAGKSGSRSHSVEVAVKRPAKTVDPLKRERLSLRGTRTVEAG